jgi:hypothetical protein
MADNVVPLQQRPTPKREIEVSLRPATPCEIDVFIAALQSWIKKSPAIEDPKAFWQAMREEVAKYPIDVLMESAKQARGLRGFSWTPSIKEMVELCERLIEPRRAELRAIRRAEDAAGPASRRRSNAPPRPSARRNARGSARLIAKQSSSGSETLRQGPVSVSAMMVQCRATSNSRTAYQQRWSAAQERECHGKVHLPKASIGRPSTVGKSRSPRE